MPDGTLRNKQGDIFFASWVMTLTLTGLVTSMVVNALVTGSIVFKILKVFLEVKNLMATSTSIERTLGSFSSTGGTKLRHVTFVIIESGMALFAIQLVRVVITGLGELQEGPTPPNLLIARNIVISIHQALNVIIRCVHFLLILFY